MTDSIRRFARKDKHKKASSKELKEFEDQSMGAWPEIIFASLSFLILVIYHGHLIYKVRTAPMTTSIGLTNHLRREWVQTVMDEKRDILAVQTLRNLVMASSFLASAAILIGLSILGAAFRTENIVDISHALNFLGTKPKSCGS